MVHEVEHRQQLLVLDALEVEEGVLVGIPAEDVPEEGTASRENDFVSLHLRIIAGEGDVEEVLLLAEFAESDADVGLEVVPPFFVTFYFLNSLVFNLAGPPDF